MDRATVPALFVSCWLLSGTLHAQEALPETLLERIINISAAYLDVTPVGEPASWGERLSLDLSTIVTFLPRIPRDDIAKDVPPVHGIPILRLSFDAAQERGAAGFQVWAGTLIPGLEYVVDFGVRPKQWLLGGNLTRSWEVTPTFIGYLHLGAQVVRSSVRGVEQPLPSDVFTETRMPFLTIGGRYQPWRLWASWVVAAKDTDIRIVGADNTTLVESSDRLQEATFPFVQQIAVGMRVTDGFQVALSEVWVPRRLYMPRVSVGWFW